MYNAYICWFRQISRFHLIYGQSQFLIDVHSILFCTDRIIVPIAAATIIRPDTPHMWSRWCELSTRSANRVPTSSVTVTTTTSTSSILSVPARRWAPTRHCSRQSCRCRCWNVDGGMRSEFRSSFLSTRIRSPRRCALTVLCDHFKRSDQLLYPVLCELKPAASPCQSLSLLWYISAKKRLTPAI